MAIIGVCNAVGFEMDMDDLLEDEMDDTASTLPGRAGTRTLSYGNSVDVV